jgi:hypothetical protein
MAVKAAFVQLPAAVDTITVDTITVDTITVDTITVDTITVDTITHSVTQNEIFPITESTKNMGKIYLSKLAWGKHRQYFDSTR